MKKILLFLLSIFFLYTNAQSPNWLWAKSAMGTNNDYGQSVATDLNGNIVATGYFQSLSITFGSITLTNSGSADVFIAKYDSNGSVLWAKSAVGSNEDRGLGITTDISGNIFVTGYFRGPTIVFDNDTLTNDTTNNTSDIFIVKYDANGNELWAKREGGDNNDAGQGVSIDLFGNVIVTGYFHSHTMTFDNTTLTNGCPNLTNDPADVFTAKYTTTGIRKWARRAGRSLNDEGSSVSTDSKGNVWITGYFASPAMNFGTVTDYFNTYSGREDIFIAKYDSAGTFLWASTAGGTLWDYGYGITIDDNDNVFLTGAFETTINFGTDTLINTTGYDMFVVKYDSSGNILWAKNAGGASIDQGLSISSDINGNVFVTGDFNSSAIVFGSDTLTNAGSGDVFIVKYTSSGNYLWAKRAGGSDDDKGSGVCNDASGNVILIGYFGSDTIKFDSNTLTNSNFPTKNVFISKLGNTIVTSNEEEFESSKFSFSPNPFATQTTVNINGQSAVSNWEIKLFDIYGREIKQFVTHSASFNISREGLKSGVYFLRIASEGKESTAKLVVVDE